MRYAQGGGLTAELRACREGLWLMVADRFAWDETNVVLAKDLRVSVRSVQRWRQPWREDSIRALAYTGQRPCPDLREAQFVQLERELGKGPPAQGWADQRWTLERIKTVNDRRLTDLHDPGCRQAAAKTRLVLAGAGTPHDGTR